MHSRLHKLSTHTHRYARAETDLKQQGDMGESDTVYRA